MVCYRFGVVCAALVCVLVTVITGFVSAQGVPAASAVDGMSAGLAPSNPLAFPGGASPGRYGPGPLALSDAMIPSFLRPAIPNLDIGFVYAFGKNLSTGRITGDYLLPRRGADGSVLFAEAHAEYIGFWKDRARASTQIDVNYVLGPEEVTATSAAYDPFPNRFDLSLGGGYRAIFRQDSILGLNAFYDGTQLSKTWYSSWGWGAEAIWYVGDKSSTELRFNWYGNQFNRNALTNAFRNFGSSFDVEASYCRPLLNAAYDVRLFGIGYGFNSEPTVYGFRGGAEATTRDGVFSVRYEVGHDRINETYNEVGLNLNIGFQLENLVRGESPFSMPEPVFVNPRNQTRTLTAKVRRNWHQPASVILARAATAKGQQFAKGLIMPPQTGNFNTTGATFNPGLTNGGILSPQANMNYVDKQPLSRVHVEFTVTNNTFSGARTYAFGPILVSSLPNNQLTSDAAGVTIPAGATGVYSFDLTPAQLAAVNAAFLNEPPPGARIQGFRVERFTGTGQVGTIQGSIVVSYYH